MKRRVVWWITGAVTVALIAVSAMIPLAAQTPRRHELLYRSRHARLITQALVALEKDLGRPPETGDLIRSGPFERPQRPWDRYSAQKFLGPLVKVPNEFDSLADAAREAWIEKHFPYHVNIARRVPSTDKSANLARLSNPSIVPLVLERPDRASGTKLMVVFLDTHVEATERSDVEAMIRAN
jgi:hypothetical protein